MWGRKKNPEPDVQAQVDADAPAAAPPSIVAPPPVTGPPSISLEPPAGQPGSTTITVRRPSPAGGGTPRIVVNGQPIDLGSLHGKMIISLDADGTVDTTDLGRDYAVVREAIEQCEAAGGDHFVELMPLVKQFVRKEISAAEFEAAAERLTGK